VTPDGAPTPSELDEHVVQAMRTPSRLDRGDRQLGFKLVVRQRFDAILAVRERTAGA